MDTVLNASEVSHEEEAFETIPQCPLCNRTSRATPLFDASFDSQPVSHFIEQYYAGRVPLHILRGAPFRIQWCADCDFYWQDHVLKSSWLSLLYNEWIDPDVSKMKESTKTLRDRMHACARLARQLRVVQAKSTGARVLDFGGGWGAYAMAAQALGCEAYLVDSSVERRLRAEQRGVIAVSSLSELENGTFDLVLAHEVLEHIAYPRAVLESLTRLLRPQGACAITVPYACADDPVLAKGAFHPLEHINSFTPKSLRLLIESCGLSAVKEYDWFVELNPNLIARAFARNWVRRLMPTQALPRSTSVLAQKR